MQQAGSPNKPFVMGALFAQNQPQSLDAHSGRTRVSTRLGQRATGRTGRLHFCRSWQLLVGLSGGKWLPAQPRHQNTTILGYYLYLDDSDGLISHLSMHNMIPPRVFLLVLLLWISADCHKAALSNRRTLLWRQQKDRLGIRHISTTSWLYTILNTA